MLSKKIIISFFIVSILLLSGCESIKNTINDVKSKYNKTEENEEIACDKICREDCPIPPGIEFDHAVYNFNNIHDTFINFIDSSEEYLMCQFTVLEDEYIAKSIVRNNYDIDIKILLDKSNTMDFCDVSCIPKLYSQYNFLFSNLINLRIGNVHYSFCSNEKGVILSSKYFSKENNDNDFVLFIESPKLNKIYEDEFNKEWVKNG